MIDLIATYKKRMTLLKKLYTYTNGDYDPNLGTQVYDEKILSAADIDFMNDLNWKANDIVKIDHDQVLPAIKKLIQDDRLSQKRLVGEFVAAVGDRYRRGTNGLKALRFATLAPMHPYTPAKKLMSCGVCGFSELDTRTSENLSMIRYSMWIGHHWGSPIGIYTDLSERILLPEIQPTQEDAAALKRLLEAVDEAPSDEKPGRLEKRISADRVLKGNAGTRRAILDSLSEIGVLPNAAMPIDANQWIDHEDMVEAGLNLDTTQGRSDLEMPYAAWRGSLGVDWDQANKWFGDYLS
ncbi:hypothetical protein [Saccharibacillus sp. JS10]|uniref:hypothetical protein n=1 Tax=Saccharibacillus sp. JS10 TaxID=2950552 RepID=UPI00210BF150|nr:hypothetical protein [Saccharibacillus sp. JS10]MCQ4088252.1 hypothetical protein [Saccharibacillus sp. JS10]